MPPKKRTCNDLSEKREGRLRRDRLRKAAAKALETEQQRNERLAKATKRKAQLRASQTNKQCAQRQGCDRERIATVRSLETDEQCAQRQVCNQDRITARRFTSWQEKFNAAFSCDSSFHYESDSVCLIENMNKNCHHCQALKWKDEAPGMCCANGKVKIPVIAAPPEPLQSSMIGDSAYSRHFLSNIYKYNNCFQMKSFGSSREIRKQGFMPTLKVQGQIYHLHGSLLPAENESNKFLQIFFLGNSDDEVNQRCQNVSGVRRQDFDKKDIVLHKRQSGLTRVSETQISYDALQYPIIYWQGQDGYHLTIRQVDPNTDMYTEIESKSLTYMRHNQRRLRADSYIHLRDAILNDDAQNIDQLVILPSSFTGSPQYMHEYVQDAMTYVKQHGRQDLFITLTCNPKWTDINEALIDGQAAHERHDTVTRVFGLKVKLLLNLLTKGKFFGDVQCFLYSIEWQK
ncbi:uncharacterized protein [Watersipora subatra]|uniref:uncharacterized protein n=1 Tax=Watersipora subatra TaxID=2589382 RepID=UPI00355B7C57